MDIDKLGREAINIIKSQWGLPNSGFVAGGSIANIIWELVSGNKAIVNDVDIFILESIIDKCDDDNSIFDYREKDVTYYEDYSGMMRYSPYTTDFYKIHESTKDGIFNNVYYKSNISDPSIVIRSFDINSTRVGYSIDEDRVYWTKEFVEFLNTGRLKVCNLLTPSHTAVRLAKKSKDLNAVVEDFEYNIIQYSLFHRFTDRVKLRFMRRYFDMYEENKDILNKYFTIERDEDIERYVMISFNKEVELFYLKSINGNSPVISVDNIFDNDNPDIFPFDSNLGSIASSDVFIFYMRNIYGDVDKSEFWSKLNFFFDSPDYFDREVDKEDIELLYRLCKYAPLSINKLIGLKLSEQVKITKFILDKFKDDPIIGISILEKIKIDNIELDEQTLLILELSVRRESNDTKGKVDKIINNKVFETYNTDWI